MNQNERICKGKKERERQRERQTHRRYRNVSAESNKGINDNYWEVEENRLYCQSVTWLSFFFFSMSWTRNDKKFLWERSTLGSSNTLRSPPIHRWHFNDDQYLRLFLFEEFLFEAERKRFDNRFCNIRKLLPKEERNHRFVGLLISPSNGLEVKFWFYWFSFYRNFVSNYSIWW